MSDIEKLIERLRLGAEIGSMRREAADALTRLVAPLPAEVGAMCRYLDGLEDRAPIRMLESLARENARLSAMLTKSSEDNDAWIEMLEDRDRLAAENVEHVRYRAALATEAKEIGDENDRLRAELNAIDQALLEEENYYANVGGDPAALRSARDTLGALARVRAKLAAENAELRSTLNAERENRADNSDPTLIDRLRAELSEVKSGYDALDSNWSRLHNVSVDAFRTALGMPDASIPEMVARLEAEALEQHQMLDALERHEGREIGVREAIAVARKIGNNAAAEDDHGMAACADSIVRKLRTLLPPPSGGEKAECTCGPFPIARVIARCPLHAPKPAAEEP